MRLSREPELSSSRFGIPPLDRLLHLFEQQQTFIPPAQPQEPGSPPFGQPRGLVQKRHATAKPPLVELTSVGPGAGKTQLLYLITAIAILPRAYQGINLQGKASAVVVVDTDGHFLVDRLAHVAKSHVDSCIQRDTSRSATARPSTPSAEQVDQLVAASLAHVHVLQPQSQHALVATLGALPAHLLSLTSHQSLDRPLHSIILDSASAFFWPIRAAEDEAQTTTIGQALPNQPDPPPSTSETYAALSRQLHWLQQRFDCIVLATTASVPHHATNVPPPPLPILRPVLPSSWTAAFPTLRLAAARDVVPPFAPAMSVQQALQERRQRQEVVQRGRTSVWVDGWGSDAWGARLRDSLRALPAGGTWGFVVVKNGVRVVEDGNEMEVDSTVLAVAS